MVMIHGDDKGLVLPPRVATVQVVVIPVPYKNVDFSIMLDACHEVSQKLESAGIRVKEDTRDNYPPGWKYSDWELKGVPLRIEIGPKDVENKQVCFFSFDVLFFVTIEQQMGLQHCYSHSSQ